MKLRNAIFLQNVGLKTLFFFQNAASFCLSFAISWQSAATLFFSLLQSANFGPNMSFRTLP